MNKEFFKGLNPQLQQAAKNLDKIKIKKTYTATKPKRKGGYFGDAGHYEFHIENDGATNRFTGTLTAGTIEEAEQLRDIIIKALNN